MLLNRFNEKRIEDLAKTLNMSFGLQVLFFDLIMKNKHIGHNIRNPIMIQIIV